MKNKSRTRLILKMKTQISIIKKLQQALREDIGSGDVTSALLIPKDAKGKAVILAKEHGIFSGGETAKALFKIADAKVSVKLKIREGQSFKKGQVLIEMSGLVRSLLKVERTMLNLLQHLCGVATQTRAFVDRVKKHRVKILDTRKTTPLWRDLEKAAVKSGGGANHRRGLYDEVFVKENHRRFGDLRKLRLRGKRGQTPGSDPKFSGFIIEVRDLHEAIHAIALNPKVILFDNFPPALLKEAVQLVRVANPKIILEASGGITLENVESYAKTGVDQISVGALTHSVKAIDLSLIIL